MPDGDLFKAISGGAASVVTDHIERFTERGILLQSGRELEADIIVTATGLQLQSLGGIDVQVDGQPRRAGDLMTYKSVLMQDVPNMANLFGYTNAPWTLKVDLAAGYICRLLDHMDRHGNQAATPRAPAGEMLDETVMDSLRSGYVQRGRDGLPRQGQALPWRVMHDFASDSEMLTKQPIDDSALEFTRAATARTTADVGATAADVAASANDPVA